MAIVTLIPGCTTTQERAPLRSPVGAVAIRAASVELNAGNPAQDRVGRFVYAGGVALEASPAHFGGLSDLEVTSDNRVLVVSDEGQLLEGRLALDANGRLTGVSDVTMTPLTDTDGRPLSEKSVSDSEGIAVLPDGDRLVSFEREHRIWRYPKDGGLPVPAPTPGAASSFPLNSGLEALTALPGTIDSYLTGSEGGMIWRCSISGGCRESVLGARIPQGFGLTAIGVSPDGRTVALLARSFELGRGVRAVVRLFPREALESRNAAQLDELVLTDPLTRDNFEGIAVVAGGVTGALRLYLLSDNNYSSGQHTYLLAFDWR